MIIAHHLIWTGYGQWLPNDPRGSTSHEIRNELIAQLGQLHHGRKTPQPCGQEIRRFYSLAESKLEHSTIRFSAGQIATIADAFARVATCRSYTIWACAILADHVHVLVRKHRDRAEQMIVELQRESRLALIRRDDVPGDHPVWGGPGWKVFQDTPANVRRTIHYIEQNPVLLGMGRQAWDFVTGYNDWPLHKRLGSQEK